MTSTPPRPAQSNQPDPSVEGDDGRSRTGARAKARRASVENEIYEQATRLFAERGFAGTSLQDIAEATGVTRSALYYYFKSKDELLERLVTETAENTGARLTEIAARTSVGAEERLREMVQLLVLTQGRHPARFRLVLRSEAELPAELSDDYARLRRESLRAIATVMDDGVKAGQFQPMDARIAALGVIGMCNWVAWWVNPDTRDDLDAVAAQFADMAIASVVRAERRRPPAAGPLGALAMVREELDYLQKLLEP